VGGVWRCKEKKSELGYGARENPEYRGIKGIDFGKKGAGPAAATAIKRKNTKASREKENATRWPSQGRLTQKKDQSSRGTLRTPTASTSWGHNQEPYSTSGI